MRRTLAGVTAALIALALVSPAAAKTEAKAVTTLRCAPTYAAAMAEAKDRGCVVFATFHADGWGFCDQQHRSVFEQPEFLQWAAENVVFLVGYEGKNHKISWGSGSEKKDGDAKDEKDEKGGKDDEEKKGKEAEAPKVARKDGDCGLYPGITCDQHEQIAKDAKAGEGGPKLEFKGWPTSFMIAPDGTVEKHTDDRAVKGLIDGVADFAKKAKLKPSRKYQGYLTALEDGDKAVEAGKWKVALTAYLKVDAVAKKMPSLGAVLPAKVEALNAAVADAFAKARDDEATDLPAKIKAVKALRAEVGAKLASGPLPVVADLDAWLKANPLPAASPPAK